MSLTSLIQQYRDEPEAHKAIWDECLKGTQSTSYLKAHRDFVEVGHYGYGERAFHWLWKSLVEALPDNFKFCEIGVFQGQSLSLVQLVAKKLGKTGKFYGITPLDSTGELSHKHPEMDYMRRINEMHVNFDLKFPTLIKGLSYDPRVQAWVKKEYAPFDLLFVDGCHDYDVAVDDIQVYGEMVKVGGYMVIDDASNDLKIPDGMIKDNWRGIEMVTNAVAHTTAANKDWQFVLAVGHNKVFKRVA
jgi:hypothetical protein